MTKPAFAVCSALVLAGCGMFDGLVRGLRDSTVASVEVLDDAIAAIDAASADWQSVLAEAQGRLTEDAQATIRNELSVLSGRTIAMAGVEARCEVDFLRARVAQELRRIRARLLGQVPAPSQPVICQVAPIAIDREAVPGHVKQLEMYGYDFAPEAPVSVFLERRGMPRLDVTPLVDRPTPYAMTVRFGGNGVQLDASSERFRTEWNGETLSTIAIIQPQTPLCETGAVKSPRTSHTVMPAAYGRGDTEFAGNGPEMTASARLVWNASSLRARLTVSAAEINGDRSGAHGEVEVTLYEPPAGWAIEEVSGEQFVSQTHRDSDADVQEVFSFGGNSPVESMQYFGDAIGPDIGTYTKVVFDFRPIPVAIVQRDGCVAPRAIARLEALSAISATTLNRLRPGANRAMLERAAWRNAVLTVRP